MIRIAAFCEPHFVVLCVVRLPSFTQLDVIDILSPVHENYVTGRHSFPLRVEVLNIYVDIIDIIEV